VLDLEEIAVEGHTEAVLEALAAIVPSYRWHRQELSTH
jgi:hypothetical protein